MIETEAAPRRVCVS